MHMESTTQSSPNPLPTEDRQTSWGVLQRELLEAIFHVLHRPDGQRDMVAVTGVCQHWRAVGSSVFFSSSWQGREAIQHPAQLIDLCPLPLAPGGLIRGVVRRERKGWGLTGRLQRCVLYQCVQLSTGCSLLPGKFLLAAEQQHSQGLTKPSWALLMNRSCQGPSVAHLTSNALKTSYVLTVAAAGSRGSGGRGLATSEGGSSCSMSSSGDGRSSNNSGSSSSWSGTGSSTLLRTSSLLHTSNSISSGLNMLNAAGDLSCCSHSRSFKAGCQPRLRPWLQIVQGPCWPASSSLTPAAAADSSAEAAAAAAAAAVAPCKQGAGKPCCLGFQEGAAATGAGTSAAGCTDAEVLLTLQYKLHFRCAVLPRRIRVALMAPAQRARLPACCTSRSCCTNAAGPEADSCSRTSPLPLAPHDGSPAWQHGLASLQQQQQAGCARQTVVPQRLQHQLLNKPPQWNQGLRCWSLNFNGRVKLASAKNFQLVSRPAEATGVSSLDGSQSSELYMSSTPWRPADTHIQPGVALAAPSEASGSSSASGHMLCRSSPWPEGVDAMRLPTGLQGSPGADGIVVQFGKVDADSFILDYDPCVTNALQAFAMALSTFGTKLLA